MKKSFLAVLMSLTIHSVAASECPKKMIEVESTKIDIDQVLIQKQITEDKHLLNKIEKTNSHYKHIFNIIDNHITRNELYHEIESNHELAQALKVEIKRSQMLVQAQNKPKSKIIEESNCRDNLIAKRLEHFQAIEDKLTLCHKAAKFNHFNLACATKAYKNSLNAAHIQTCADSTTLHDSFLTCLDIAPDLNSQEIYQCGKLSNSDDYIACLQEQSQN